MASSQTVSSFPRIFGKEILLEYRLHIKVDLLRFVLVLAALLINWLGLEFISLRDNLYTLTSVCLVRIRVNRTDLCMFSGQIKSERCLPTQRRMRAYIAQYDQWGVSIAVVFHPIGKSSLIPLLSNTAKHNMTK